MVVVSSSPTVDVAMGSSVVILVTSSMISSNCSRVVTSIEADVVVIVCSFCFVVISTVGTSVVVKSSVAMLVVVSSNGADVVVTGSSSRGGAQEIPTASSRVTCKINL